MCEVEFVSFVALAEEELEVAGEEAAEVATEGVA